MTYRATEFNVREHMDYFNEEVFMGLLEVSEIELDIDFLDTEWGFCVDEEGVTVLGLTDMFDSYEMFRTILAHEMIHAWQIQEGEKVDHGSSFVLLASLANKVLDLLIPIEAIH